MEKGLTVDMWFGDAFARKQYRADAVFYPQGSFGHAYRGNIYNAEGKAIGDYGASASAIVEANFLIEWKS